MDTLAWCRQRMLAAGTPLAASLPFAPREQRDAILALRTLVAEIAAVPDEVNEPDVARRKLDWWREALPGDTAHPAIEAVRAAGAEKLLSSGAFTDLIRALDGLIVPPRFERSEQAWGHCLEIGGPPVHLEAELIGEPEPNSLTALEELGAFAYLVRLVRDLGIDARANRWLVPLDLQATWQISRQNLLDGNPGRGWDGLIRAWLEGALSRCNSAIEALSAEQRWRHRHLMVSHALDRRLAEALARKPQHIVEHRIRPSHMGNVWRAWRTAGTLRRRFSPS